MGHTCSGHMNGKAAIDGSIVQSFAICRGNRCKTFFLYLLQLFKQNTDTAYAVAAGYFICFLRKITLNAMCQGIDGCGTGKQFRQSQRVTVIPQRKCRENPVIIQTLF